MFGCYAQARPRCFASVTLGLVLLSLVPAVRAELPSPTLQTVFRYFHALGQRLAWTREALPAKKPARHTTA